MIVGIGDSRDLAGRAIDTADPMIEYVGQKNVALSIERHVKGLVESCGDRGAAVTAVAGNSCTRNGRDLKVRRHGHQQNNLNRP